MPSTTELTQRFTEPTGFKKLFGFLNGGRAKKAHALFIDADESRASRAYSLDRREHDGRLYFIKAVSTRGDLEETTLNELTNVAREVELGNLRYAGMMADTLPEAIGSDGNGEAIHRLGRFENGIIVYPVSIMSKNGDAAHAVWAQKDGKFYVLPIDDKQL